MNALGVGILDFLAENPSPAEIDAVRTQVVTPIRTGSATSPIFNRAFRSVAHGPCDFEVPPSSFITVAGVRIRHRWCE